MYKIILVAFALFTIAPALAQTPDSAFLQRALSSLQTQRNSALDAQAVAEAKLAGAVEELTKATAKIKELEDKNKVEDKK